MTRRREVDIIDAHVTSTSNVVDVFSQYPLLDGDKRYTVEITEFTCPLAGPRQNELELNLFSRYGERLRGLTCSPTATR